MRRLGEKLVAGGLLGVALACEPGGERDIFDELCLETVGNVSACEMRGDDWTAAQLEDCEVQRESLEDEATVECREAVLDLDVCIAVDAVLFAAATAFGGPIPQTPAPPTEPTAEPATTPTTEPPT